MKTRKLKGTPEGRKPEEMTRLKDLWRNGMSPETKDAWLTRLASTTTHARLRAELKEQFGITLGSDSQITRFREFIELQERLDQIGSLTQAVDAHFREMFAGMSEAEIREKVMAIYYARAVLLDDVNVGKFALRHSLSERRLELQKTNVQKAERTDALKALEICLEDTKQYPAVNQLFKDAFAALKQARAGK